MAFSQHMAEIWLRLILSQLFSIPRLDCRVRLLLKSHQPTVCGAYMSEGSSSGAKRTVQISIRTNSGI